MRAFLVLALIVGCSGSSGSESAAGDRSAESAAGDRSAESAAGDRRSESESESESASESASASASASAAAPPVPTPGTLRFVVVPDGPELLGSEERALGQLRSGLARGRTLDDGAPTAPERAWLDEPGALPDAWATFETVVVLRIAEPRTLRNGRRMTRGLRSVHLLRPPATTPVYALEGEPVGLAPAEELEWLEALLGSLARTEDDE